MGFNKRGRWIQLGAILIMCAVATPLMAQVSAEDLFKLCASPQDDLAVTLCRTYLSGLLDGLRMTDGQVGVFSFCLPEEGVSTELVQAMYTRYFLKHREERRMLEEGYTARITIVTMLTEEYPCPGAKKE